MIADVADYSEWRNNRRATAIIFSAMMIGLKLGLSIGGALVTYILGAYGYLAKVAGNPAAQQPRSALDGIKLLVSLYPAIPFLLGIGLLFFYVINKDMENTIENDLKTRRKN